MAGNELPGGTTTPQAALWQAARRRGSQPPARPPDHAARSEVGYD
jgi:hypothetical protein